MNNEGSSLWKETGQQKNTYGSMKYMVALCAWFNRSRECHVAWFNPSRECHVAWFNPSKEIVTLLGLIHGVPVSPCLLFAVNHLLLKQQQCR